jgi:hypothetical protein
MCNLKEIYIKNIITIAHVIKMVKITIAHANQAVRGGEEEGRGIKMHQGKKKYRR